MSKETFERFFRCPACRLPHTLDTTRCPVTGQTVSALGAAPEVELEAARTVRMPRRPTAVPMAGRLIPGQMLDDKYTVGKIIGSGAMGTVYEGQHVLLGRAVAIKAVDPAHWRQARMQRRFFDEGRVLASISHPNVVDIYDLGLHLGVPYLVMERLQGRTLQSRVDEPEPLPIDEIEIIARQILSGLGAVHERGIVHRDLKPANVFLTGPRGAPPRLKLLDFGVSARVLGAGEPDTEGAPDSHGEIVGTPAYLAPEQALGEPVDAGADIWALGVTLYEMLTGELPFRSTSFNGLMRDIAERDPPPPSALRRDTPASLDAVVMRALRKPRADRFAGARAMLEAIGSPPVTVSTGATRELALIAEPDPQRAELYGAIAGELGLLALIAGDGAEARELLSSVGVPRLSIVNLSLAREDGFSLLRALRSLAPASLSAAIAVSPMQAMRAAARDRREELGLAAVLDQTVPAAALRQAFERALAGAPPLPAHAQDAPENARAREEAEDRRLDRIKAMRLVDDAPSDKALEQLVAETAREFGVPVALISLLLKDRQWFKAHVGLTGQAAEERGTPRDWAFCQHVVESRTPLVVSDARHHPVFADNPMVQRGEVGAYAGAPLVTPGGDVIGTLCIVDPAPRSIRREVVDDLVLLARRVAGELELRAAESRKEAPRANTRARLTAMLANLDTAVLLLSAARTIIFANHALADLAGVPVESIVGATRDAFLADLSRRFDDPAEFLRRVRVLPTGAFAAREDFVLTRPAPRVLRWSAKPVEVADGIGHMETYTEILLPDPVAFGAAGSTSSFGDPSR